MENDVFPALGRQTLQIIPALACRKTPSWTDVSQRLQTLFFAANVLPPRHGLIRNHVPEGKVRMTAAREKYP